MTRALKKYKKDELIDLINEYAEEIINLQDEKYMLSNLRDTLQDQLDNMGNDKDLKKKTCEYRKRKYLMNRIKVCPDVERRAMYMRELSRLQ